MAATADQHESLRPVESFTSGSDKDEGEERTVRSVCPDRPERLPWIGALRRPGVGPMVVVNDSGYLIPLYTSSDLLRSCRYLWRASQY
jgi:hypothetical protein